MESLIAGNTQCWKGQTSHHCRSFCVLEATATLTPPHLQVRDLYLLRQPPALEKLFLGNLKNIWPLIKRHKCHQQDNCAFFHGHEKKANLKERQQTSLGQRGPSPGTCGCGKWTLGFLPAFLGRRWPLCSQLSLMPSVVPRFGFNFFQSSISFLSNRQLQPKPLQEVESTHKSCGLVASDESGGVGVTGQLWAFLARKFLGRVFQGGAWISDLLSGSWLRAWSLDFLWALAQSWSSEIDQPSSIAHRLGSL